MIQVERLAEPEVLCRHKDDWCRSFLEERGRDPKKRPHSTRYAHEEIVSTLEAMSHHKCFYCEQSTKGARAEVDHHVDVADQPDLAFTCGRTSIFRAGTATTGSSLTAPSR